MGDREVQQATDAGAVGAAIVRDLPDTYDVILLIREADTRHFSVVSNGTPEAIAVAMHSWFAELRQPLAMENERLRTELALARGELARVAPTSTSRERP